MLDLIHRLFSKRDWCSDILDNKIKIEYLVNHCKYNLLEEFIPPVASFTFKNLRMRNEYVLSYAIRKCAYEYHQNHLVNEKFKTRYDSFILLFDDFIVATSIIEYTRDKNNELISVNIVPHKNSIWL